MNSRSVAQLCNLLYRRFVIGRASESSSALVLADVPQNTILRYGKLQICATRPRRALNTYSKEREKTPSVSDADFLGLRVCLKMWRQPSWLPVRRLPAASLANGPADSRGWKPLYWQARKPVTTGIADTLRFIRQALDPIAVPHRSHQKFIQ